MIRVSGSGTGEGREVRNHLPPLLFPNS